MILENHIHLISQALIRSKGSLVLSIREVSQSLEPLYHLIYPHIFPEEEEDNISLFMVKFT